MKFTFKISPDTYCNDLIKDIWLHCLSFVKSITDSSNVDSFFFYNHIMYSQQLKRQCNSPKPFFFFFRVTMLKKCIFSNQNKNLEALKALSNEV